MKKLSLLRRSISFFDRTFITLRMAMIPIPVFLLAAFFLWWWLRPKEKAAPVYPEPLVRAVERACQSAVDALPRGEKPHGQRTLVLPFKADNDLLVTNTLVTTIDNDPRASYKTIEESRRDWLLENFKWLIGEIYPKGDFSEETAITRGRRADAQYVIAGEVRKSSGPDEKKGRPAFVEFAIRMYYVEKDTNVLVLDEQFTSEEAKTADEPSESSNVDEPQNTFGGAPFILGVLVFTLVWPVALSPIIKRVLWTENNGFILIALIVIAGVPIALAAPWAFVAGYSTWRLLVYIVGSFVVVLWCIVVMSQVAEAVKY